jgi:cyclopropane-fatty-acyl-phospholipid synthase
MSTASSHLSCHNVGSAVPLRLKAFIQDLLSAIEMPVNIDCWAVETITAPGRNAGDGILTLAIKHPGVLRLFLEKRSVLILIHAYLDGKIDFHGRVEDLIKLGGALAKTRIHPLRAIAAGLEVLTLPAVALTPHRQTWKRLPSGSRDRDREAVRYHYDVGNEFYKLWLDKRMIYSCAHYGSQNSTLDLAQEEKLDLICRKLQLNEGDRLLDIGCGWAGLICHAAHKYGAIAHGITLSEAQLEFCRQKIEEEGLSKHATVELLHYKDLPQNIKYDKIASIEMIEQVGFINYPAYFGNILRCLNTGGLFLCQAITTIKNRAQQDLAEKFIADYIFPDGELANLPKTLAEAKDAGWEIVDIESWRPHYARTLREWARRLEQVSAEAAALVGKQRVRLWHLYLIGCALSYESNRLGLYQLLFRKSEDLEWNLPWRRPGWLT